MIINDTLMENCIKGWSQSNDIPLIKKFVATQRNLNPSLNLYIVGPFSIEAMGNELG